MGEAGDVKAFKVQPRLRRFPGVKAGARRREAAHLENGGADGAGEAQIAPRGIGTRHTALLVGSARQRVAHLLPGD